MTTGSVGSNQHKSEWLFPKALGSRHPRVLKTEEKKMQKQTIDFDALEKELDAEFTTEETTPVEEVTEEAPETQEQETEVSEDLDDDYEFEDDSEYEEEENPAVNDPDEHKRNEAFKQLREERDKLAESDKFLTDLAAQYGLSKEELVKRYKDEANKKQAEKEGMTPEQFQKMQKLQKEVEEIKLNRRKEVFNYEAQRLSEKYQLSEPQMVDLFNYAQSNGIAILDNPTLLEFAYRAKNYDNALEQGRQKQLETSKQRRSKSVGQTGTQKSAPPADEMSQMEAEIDAYLKEQKIIK